MPLCVSDDGIHCFERADLRPLWQRLIGRTTYEPTVLADKVVLGGNDGVSAFSHDGMPRWRLAEYGAAFSPTVTNDGLLFGTLGGDLVSATVDGVVRWHRRFHGWMYSPAVAGNVVASGGQAAVLHAVQRDSGAPLWRLALDQELVNRPVAIDDGHFVVTTFAGTLFKVHAQTGRAVWRVALGVPSRTPVAAGDLLLCALFDGKVAAVASGDGTLRWQTALPGPVVVAAADAQVLVHDGEHLFVLARRDGAIVQRRRFAAPIVAARWLGNAQAVVFLRGMRNQVRAEAVYLARGNPPRRGD